MSKNESERLQMELKGVSQLTSTDDMGLLQLVDKECRYQLIIPCDGHALYQFKLRLFKQADAINAKLLPEVLKQLYNVQQETSLEVEIYDTKDGEYLVNLIDGAHDKRLPIRCSDAILLALVWAIPIYATIQVLKLQATPYDVNCTQLPIPINVLNDDLLDMALKGAIENEDYEKASYIRDQIKARKKANK